MKKKQLGQKKTETVMKNKQMEHKREFRTARIKRNQPKKGRIMRNIDDKEAEITSSGLVLSSKSTNSLLHSEILLG